MGHCLWGKQSSSEARAEGSVTNVASLGSDQCGHLGGSCRCTYTYSTAEEETNKNARRNNNNNKKMPLIYKNIYSLSRWRFLCMLTFI